eukprot:13157339-Alexandrium_andersonii.AAC.1
MRPRAISGTSTRACPRLSTRPRERPTPRATASCTTTRASTRSRASSTPRAMTSCRAVRPRVP